MSFGFLPLLSSGIMTNASAIVFDVELMGIGTSYTAVSGESKGEIATWDEETFDEHLSRKRDAAA
jgi:hypothetical protein